MPRGSHRTNQRCRGCAVAEWRYAVMLGLTGVIHSGHNINHSKVDSMEWRPGGHSSRGRCSTRGVRTWQHISLLGASCCRLNMVGVLEIMSSSTRLRLMMAVSSVALGCPGGAAAEADAVLGGQTGAAAAAQQCPAPAAAACARQQASCQVQEAGQGP